MSSTGVDVGATFARPPGLQFLRRRRSSKVRFPCPRAVSALAPFLLLHTPLAGRGGRVPAIRLVVE